MLKMKAEHYERLSAALDAIHATVCREGYEHAGLSAERFRWDMFCKAVDDDSPFMDELYAYLNDSNIDSALRKYFGDAK